MTDVTPNFDPVRVSETNATMGLTIRDLVLEVRANTQNLQRDLELFKSQVVLKSEFNIAAEAKKTARRYFITTMTAMIGVGTACVFAVINYLN